MQTNVPLLAGCAPKLTVSGIVGSQTVNAATNFAVSMHYGGANIGGDKVGEFTGSWTQNTGTMVLTLATTEFTTTSEIVDGVDDHVDVLLMTFVVKNPRHSRDYVEPTMKIDFTTAGCTGTQSVSTAQDPSQMVLEDPTASGVFYSDNYVSDFVRAPVFNVNRVRFVSSCI